MKYRKTDLEDARLIELDKLSDERGFFARLFCEEEAAKNGVESRVVQINNSFNAECGTTRGMHFQKAPKEEAKVVRCISGRIWDIITDLRPTSATYLKSFGAELTAENRKMMYIPKGFAHGFQTLEPNTELLYLMSEFYSSDHASGVGWDDPAFSIVWPLEPTVISEKDMNWPIYKPTNFSLKA